jgi:hypothetical protein
MRAETLALGVGPGQRVGANPWHKCAGRGYYLLLPLHPLPPTLPKESSAGFVGENSILFA